MPQLIPDEPKSRVRIRAPKDPDDKRYEAMATEPTPVTQDWFSDPSKLPKRPPGKR